MPELFALAEMGSPMAANAIGESYYWGHGLPLDRVEGLRWFVKAREGGSWRGLLNYSKALIRGGDFEGAANALAPAARQRWGPALYWHARADWGRRQGRSRERLARLYAPLSRAAAQGDPAARDLLAGLMVVGLYGLGRIPRGFRMSLITLKELGAREAKAARNMPSGETLH